MSVKPNLPRFHAQHRDIGGRADGQIAQFFVVNFARRIPGGVAGSRRPADMPIARNLLITLSMSFMPAFMLPM